jgi:hypothetical protein
LAKRCSSMEASTVGYHNSRAREHSRLALRQQTATRMHRPALALDP